MFQGSAAKSNITLMTVIFSMMVAGCSNEYGFKSLAKTNVVKGDPDPIPIPTPPPPPPSPTPTPTPTPSPTPCPPGSLDPACFLPINNFGMITNQTKCVLCHMTIYGDLGSADNQAFVLHENSKATVFGNIFSNLFIKRFTYNEQTGQLMDGVMNPQKNILERIVLGLRVDRVGVDKTPIRDFKIYEGLANGDTDIRFPLFKAAKLKAGSLGTLSQNGVVRIDKNHMGDIILDGRTNMITVDGEIYIDGDVILQGKFKGIGTIYIKGNVFIPDDIIVEGNDTLFAQYRQDVSKADMASKTAIINKVSALRIAASANIIIGDPGVTPAGINMVTTPFPPDTRLKNYVVNRDNTDYTYTSYYSVDVQQSLLSHTSILDANGVWQFVNRTRMEAVKSYLTNMEGYGFASTAERSRVFKATLDPNYFARLKPEYDLPVQVCTTQKNFRVSFGSVARIDATLYASKSIGGVMTGGANMLINGGIITNNLSLLGGTGNDLESFNGDIMSEKTRRIPNVFEMAKTCSDVVSNGAGQFTLSPNVVNPMNGIKVGESAITYDFRLRNSGSGFDIMRDPKY